jgi:hypothetical protein
MCISKADSSAHTKWFWGEILIVLGASIAFVFAISSDNYDAASMRILAYLVVAVSIAVFSVWAICRRHRAPADGKRAILLILTGLCQVICYYPAFASVYSISSAFSISCSIGVVASADFVVMMFWMDRNEKIEHSVPYAVAYAWALSASVLGASFIIGLFYRFDNLISSVFGQSSLLVSQVALALFSSIVLWVFGQVSGRVTTAGDHTAFMFPGLFAVVGCAGMHKQTHT